MKTSTQIGTKEIPMRVSKIELLLRCEKLFWFQEEKRTPYQREKSDGITKLIKPNNSSQKAHTGILTHLGVEAVLRGLDPRFECQKQAHVVPEANIDEVKTMVRGFRTDPETSFVREVDVSLEQEYIFEYKGYYFSGSIDLVVGDQVWELKTGSGSPEELLSDSRVQLTLAALALKKQVGGLFRLRSYLNLKDGQSQAILHSSEQANILEVLDKVIERLEAHKKTARSNPNCKWCPLRRDCW